MVAPSLYSVESQIVPCYLCLPAKKKSKSMQAQYVFPLFAQWFPAASELRQQQCEWNPPKFKVNVFVIVHKKSLYSHGYLQTKDKHASPAWRYKKENPTISVILSTLQFVQRVVRHAPTSHPVRT